MTAQILDFPRRSSGFSVSMLIREKCSCPSCQELYEERKHQITSELASIARIYTPEAEDLRSNLIKEMLWLNN